MIELWANLGFLALDAAAIGWLLRRRTGDDAFRAVAYPLLAQIAIAVLASGGGFLAMRLLAWVAFAHGPLLLALAALSRWRSGARRVAIACGAAAALAWAIAADAFLVEPHWLEVSRVKVVSAKVDRPLRIVVLSDIQTDAVGDYERDVLRRAMAERPDLVLLPGDYVQEQGGERRARLEQAFRELLAEAGLAALLGVYAVQGNCEVGGWPRLFEGLPVEAPVRTTHFRPPGAPVEVVALSFSDSFEAHLRVPPSDRFQIVFGHGPDFALGDVPADLLVAGHTHGGQVRLPFVGPLITFSQIPRAWAAGTTALDGGRTLVVSRGVGMERGDAPRLRFLCRPELVVIDVVPPGS